jgi:two-component system sensor histidine kinase YesM
MFIKMTKQWLLPNSIRTKVISLVLLLTLPLILMLIYNNRYATHVVRNQVAESYSHLLNLYMVQVDNDLEAAQKIVNDTLALDPNFLAMEQAKENSDDVYHFAKIQLMSGLLNQTSKVQTLESFFVYHSGRDDFLEVYKTRHTYGYREQMKSYLTNWLGERSVAGGLPRYQWVIQSFDQQSYLLYVVNSGNTYMGAVINANELKKPLELLDLGSTGGAVYATNQGEAITDLEHIDSAKMDWRKNIAAYFQTGEIKDYVVLTETSEKGDFHLVALIPDRKILENLPYLQQINIWILLASFIVLPLGLFYLRRTILIPLQRIVSSMKKIQGDNLKVRIAPYPTSLEFQLVNNTFNRMMEQIEDLKINVYEEQLGKQREELQRLQLQMNPHFFMNSLNMLYSLGKVNKMDLVMELSLCLIYYFRFMVRSNLSFVQLKDELEHTRNYLRIQELRYPGSLTYEINTPNYVMERRIPPLFIQTFIENAIKHGVMLDKPTHIAVHIDIVEHESAPCMQIRIEDNGQGFPKDVLEVLNAGGSLVNSDGEHTGIWNVQRRLKLLYQAHAAITFHNKAASGAVVQLILPLHHGE